ncbi:protein-glutamate methylesterase/protein-glutamine glutaminase [Cohnella herbarum]|uniref:Protein-glutamate methylesterase/protein-glutamine glutaminase n=1 Tax=Cohnella herbarum TaxID=2728023 RepID=A0A7Z2ZKZ5_9BACL|nr:chemotaxis response regulator protein-glutamate methylesterase [Cohnella herbarum]QJD83360.1 chemotaxis response regulator protein-glutamate methylesterase [Cohnella herbarum]
MPEFKVLIVDDSPFMRKVFSDVIDADAAFEVLATASNGKEAVDLTLKLKPDIITMDLEMPLWNGIEALKRIMALQPTPVIMLSAVTDNGTRDTIRALQYGAIDFIRKPDGAVKLDIRQVGEQLLEKLHIALETVSSGALRMLPAVEEQGEAAAEIIPVVVDSPKPPVEKTKKPDVPAEPLLNKTRIVESFKPPDQPVKTRNAELPRKLDRIPDKPDSSRLKPNHASPGISTSRLPERPLVKDLASQTVKKAASLELKTAMPKKSVRTTVTEAQANRDQSQAIPPTTNPKPTSSFTHLVAIGTSTGGPRALHEVLTGIPADFPAPILVVQHMPPKFTHSLAQRLDNFCSINVREAVDGELIETATAYIAPGGRHMTLRKEVTGTYRIKLSDEVPKGGHKPSVDVMFESLVGHPQLKRHIVLMTGMGSDGAKGMKALQTDGAQTTIAEAEQTCVVYGMPRSAVELGAVSQILPLQGIAPVLVQEVKSRKP